MLTTVKSLWRRLTTPWSVPSRYRLEPFEPLSSEPDRELDVLLERLPITVDTLETHLALAELFRKRGQIERAIRIHETLLDADLRRQDANRVRVELAQDFFSAGLLGRAETELESLILDQGERFSAQAFRLWLVVLEREQEWERAIKLVRDYGQPGSGNMRLANLYCEYVGQLKGQGKLALARSALKEARKLSDSARTFIASSELETSLGHYHKALRMLKEALVRDVRRVDVILPGLKRLSRLVGGEASLRRYLEKLYDYHPSHRVLEAILDLTGDSDPRQSYWQTELERVVNSGASFGLMQRWLEQRRDIGATPRAVLLESIQRLKLRLPDGYQCNHCGYESGTMIWFCPQCERWETAFSRHEQRVHEDRRQAALNRS
ncbi:tetratricopeptide repeat protein [Saccharospirillum mangrovi]|uniref:tetratricopeptide repeat protein n=1 Tax=Saccharospirillum mangrovi TaxID=2161747 RepID=UPI000D387E19|nr:tetratricopeptide repeat protein [Saccharospirillum mangrovi]